MKITIIFHSVNGNTYLLAKYFKEAFKNKGSDVELLRVEDNNLKPLSEKFTTVKEFYEEMIALPVAAPENMMRSDLILMGSPTYFGNVSAQMKAFMDSCADLWVAGKFVGKKIAAFTTAAHAEGGGDLCLQAIHIFGRHMGMVSLSVPSNLVPGKSSPAYGVIHYSGGPADKRPDKNNPVVSAFADYLIESL